MSWWSTVGRLGWGLTEPHTPNHQAKIRWGWKMPQLLEWLLWGHYFWVRARHFSLYCILFDLNLDMCHQLNHHVHPSMEEISGPLSISKYMQFHISPYIYSRLHGEVLMYLMITWWSPDDHHMNAKDIPRHHAWDIFVPGSIHQVLHASKRWIHATKHLEVHAPLLAIIQCFQVICQDAVGQSYHVFRVVREVHCHKKSGTPLYDQELFDSVEHLLWCNQMSFLSSAMGV